MRCDDEDNIEEHMVFFIDFEVGILCLSPSCAAVLATANPSRRQPFDPERV